MNVSNIYIDLFRENRQVIDSGISPILNGCRDAALEALQKYGLPTTKQEEYLHFNAEELFRTDWGLNLGRLNMPVDYAEAFRCNVPNLSTLLYYLAGDTLVQSESAARVQTAEGVLIGSLNSLAKDYPELVGRYYAKIAKMERSGIAAINTLFAQDGLFVYVPDGVVVEKPVQLVSLLQSKVDMMVNRRILVVLGNNAQLKLLLCDHSIDSRNALSVQVVEAFVGSGSQFSYYDLEETHTANNRINELFIEQQADSSVELKTITLHNGKTRNSIFATLAGKGASLNVDGVAITDKQQQVDNYTYIDHKVPDCTSSELYKYVLDQESQGAFAGRVLVREDSQRTVAHQTNRNICLTRSARIFTQPQLEIYADDVKCSHGATVGQLDDKAMFYMQQRGISAAEARTLLMLAFVDEVIGNVKLEPLRDRLRRLVEKRFRGELGHCEGCNICK